MPTLICKSVTYLSESDEAAFFEWIAKIKCIKKYDGLMDELHLYIPQKNISDICLRELIALFYRYKINLKQLKLFLTGANKKWFANKTAYWYKKVF